MRQQFGKIKIMDILLTGVDKIQIIDTDKIQIIFKVNSFTSNDKISCYRYGFNLRFIFTKANMVVNLV